MDKKCTSHAVFGGEKNERQVLQVDDCGLSRIGTTPFDHVFGACASTDVLIMLCFNLDSNDYKRCRQASSPSGPWTQMALSRYDHRATSIATSAGKKRSLVAVKKWVETLDEFLAVGSRYPDNIKAEIYNIGTGAWKTVNDYRRS